MVLYNFKSIQVVPTGKEFIDIVLTRTQRKTPTVVNQGIPIGSIRKFYMRKVKFTEQTISEKLHQILSDFPILDEIHPFYSDLMNILYDKDHYKLALGQLNNAKRLVENISRDSIRLLKYGDSLYRCKMLKRAALGRMVKVLKRQGSSFAYLEEVRQHLSRLPSIDPNTRTLLVFGYPNVGKSSFMNKITRANVDVQKYAFTTKSLFVGHMDYKYFKWQVIDTPGILDRPIEDRNTIEMQSITALAHLRCAILYFIDISIQCGYTIEQQASLFESIRPLFKNKPLILVLNKVDVRPLSDLDDEEKSIIKKVIDSVEGAVSIEMSSLTDIGVSEVKERACEMLLDMRVEMKMKSSKRDDIVGRTHVAIPKKRDDKERKPFKITGGESMEEESSNVKAADASKDGEPAVNFIRSSDMDTGEYDTYTPFPLPPSLNKETRSKLSEFETQKHLFFMMDPDYSGVDHKNSYLLEDDDWKHDVIPEIIDGMNIMDFWDENLAQKLLELEEEEEKLLRNIEISGGDDDGDYLDQLTPEERETLMKIRKRKKEIILESRSKVSRNHSFLPRSVTVGNTDQFKDHLEGLGFDSSKAYERVRSLSRARGRKRQRDNDGNDSMDIEGRKSMLPRIRDESSFADERQRQLAGRLEKKAYTVRNREGKSGPGDNSIVDKMPKHLFSGKRSFKADRR